MRLMDLDSLVKERLNGHSKCSGHCQEQSELKLLQQKGMTIGCYRCPSGYVSCLIQYGKELDLQTFRTFLSAIQSDVTDEDIRVATRYRWDLAITSQTDDAILREAYWRQSYRRSKSEDPHRISLFACTKCDSFYSQPITNKNTLCPRCQKTARTSSTW